MQDPRAPSLFVSLLATGAGLMLVPAAFAAFEQDWRSAASFLSYAALGLGLCLLLALALGGRKTGEGVGGFLAFFTVAPAFYALPLRDLGGVRFEEAWFDTLSCLTTSGDILQGDFSNTLQLWRALCGWYGGAVVLLLGAKMLSPHLKVATFLHIARLYLGGTGALWLALLWVEKTPLEALFYAMGTISTSGIHALNGQATAFAREAVVGLGLCAALGGGVFYRRRRETLEEARFGGRLALGGAAFIALGSVSALWSSQDPWRLLEFGKMLWGAGFTALSFLTTTGYTSALWAPSAPPVALLLLMGLAIIGGGLATPAGGVKLFRIRGIAEQSLHEVRRLSTPHRVDAPQDEADLRKIWAAALLFISAVVGLMVSLAAFNVPLKAAMTLSAAALSNTVQLARLEPEIAVILSQLAWPCKLAMMLGMLAGRLEIIALFAAFGAHRRLRRI